MIQNNCLPSNISKEKIAAAYLRTSTKEQHEEGNSKEIQRISVKRYAEEKGLHLVEDLIFEDEKSASTGITYHMNKDINGPDDIWTKRPKFKNLIARALNDEFRHLIIYTRDRFTRNLQEHLSLLMFFDRLGIKLHFSGPGQQLETNDMAMQQFFETMLSNLAELEANVIASRVKLGAIAKVKQNFWSGGKKPYGYKLAIVYENGKHRTSRLVKISHEADIVKEIFHNYLLGYTYEDIAELVKSQHPDIPKQKWTKSTVASILGNENYTGRIVWDKRGGIRNPGKHQNPYKSDIIADNEIISTDIFNEVNRIKKIQSGKNAKYFSTPFLLKDKLYCGLCGSPMKCKNNGKNKTHTYYCFGKSPKKVNNKRVSELLIPKEYIEKAVLLTLNNTLNDFIKDNFEALWQQYQEKIDTEKTDSRNSIEEIEELVVKNNQLLNQCITFIDTKGNFFNKNTNLEYNEDLFQSMESFKTYLELNNSSLNATKKAYNEKLMRAYMTKEEFLTALTELIDEFTSYQKQTTPSNTNEAHYLEVPSRRQRMLIDKLIDKILVNSTSKGITLIIHFKISHKTIPNSHQEDFDIIVEEKKLVPKNFNVFNPN